MVDNKSINTRGCYANASGKQRKSSLLVNDMRKSADNVDIIEPEQQHEEAHKELFDAELCTDVAVANRGDSGHREVHTGNVPECNRMGLDCARTHSRARCAYKTAMHEHSAVVYIINTPCTCIFTSESGRNCFVLLCLTPP